MKRFFIDIKNVLVREIQFIRYDINIIVIILLAPLIYPFIFGTAYMHKSENDISVTIVDYDNSLSSRELIRMIDANQLMAVESITGNYNDGVEKIKSLTTQGMIVIPDGYEADLKADKGTTLKIYLNTTRFLVSNDINKAINEIALSKALDIRTRHYEMAGYGSRQAEKMAQPVNAEIRPMFSVTESYGDFLLPGVLVLILQQTLFFGLGESIAKEREQNTLSQLFSHANNNIPAIIFGKGFFYFILFASYSFLFYTMHFYLFNLKIIGNMFALAFATIIFLMSIIFIGLFISSFFKKKLLSLQVLTFTSYPIFLISGYSWPLETMPAFMQGIANLIPSTPYFNLFIKITQMGAGWSEITTPLLHLSLLAAAGLLLCLIRIKILLKGEENFLHQISEKINYKTI